MKEKQTNIQVGIIWKFNVFFSEDRKFKSPGDISTVSLRDSRTSYQQLPSKP